MPNDLESHSHLPTFSIFLLEEWSQIPALPTPHASINLPETYFEKTQENGISTTKNLSEGEVFTLEGEKAGL